MQAEQRDHAGFFRGLGQIRPVPQQSRPLGSQVSDPERELAMAYGSQVSRNAKCHFRIAVQVPFALVWLGVKVGSAANENRIEVLCPAQISDAQVEHGTCKIEVHRSIVAGSRSVDGFRNSRRRQPRKRSRMALRAVLAPVRARSPHRFNEALIPHRGGGLAAVARPSRRGRVRPGQRPASHHRCALRRNRRQLPQECPGRRRPPRRHLVLAGATGSRPAGRHRRW